MVLDVLLGLRDSPDKIPTVLALRKLTLTNG